MGRRSISSTKAGKFMNPTDQARKEARRKELKKNKKQRLQVRQAVIKQKDPKHLLNDMELLDKMEFDPNNPPPYSVKVIQDKRRKLKETWTKIYQFYQREDPKQAYELKQMELDYERRHQHMAYVYESIMQAQRVKIDDIPLPMGSGAHLTTTANFIDIPMPPANIPIPAPPPSSESSTTTTTTSQPKSILKPVNTNTFNITATNKELLIKYAASFDGVPQAPTNTMPPDLAEFECEDDENELGLTLDDHFSKQIDRSKKIRFNETTTTSASDVQMAISQPQPPPPPSQALQTNLLLPPPQMPAASTVVSPYLSGKLALQAQQVAAVMGATPSSKSKLVTSSSQNKSILKQHQVSTSGQHQSVGGQGKTLTIEAKPVLRNKIAEITRFVPTSLLVRRGAGDKASGGGVGVFGDSQQNTTTSVNNDHFGQYHQPYDYMSQQQQTYANLNPLMGTNGASGGGGGNNNYMRKSDGNNPTQSMPPKLASTDAAYESFMKEIGKLL